jgi:hypothetical protein
VSLGSIMPEPRAKGTHLEGDLKVCGVRREGPSINTMLVWERDVIARVEIGHRREPQHRVGNLALQRPTVTYEGGGPDRPATSFAGQLTSGTISPTSACRASDKKSLSTPMPPLPLPLPGLGGTPLLPGPARGILLTERMAAGAA